MFVYRVRVDCSTGINGTKLVRQYKTIYMVIPANLPFMS